MIPRKVLVSFFMFAYTVFGVESTSFWYPPAIEQTPRTADPTDLSPEEVARRDEMMKPATALLRAHDNVNGYQALLPVIAAYPNDLHILIIAGPVAILAGHYDEAIDFLNRALVQRPAYPLPLRLFKIQAEAHLMRWGDFNRDVSELRAAKKAGIDHDLDNSKAFLIDTFDAGGVPVQTFLFPLLGGPFHTLYRFQLSKPAPPAPSIPGGCADPGNRYLDMESDDVDETRFVKAHPDLVAKGDRAYSLDSYPGRCTQALIKFYDDGEPKYETVRQDVIKVVSALPVRSQQNH